MEPILALMGAINRVIINPLLALMFAAGLLVFVWGLITYLYKLNVEGDQDKEAKSHMFWGIVGMFIMVAAYAIIKLIASTIGTRLPPGY